MTVIVNLLIDSHEYPARSKDGEVDIFTDLCEGSTIQQENLFPLIILHVQK